MSNQKKHDAIMIEWKIRTPWFVEKAMTTQALFVDLPNFCSHLLDSDIEDPRLLRDYFLYWLDFDRLAEKLTGQFSSVWVFHSGRRFGPRSNRKIY